ncbi:MAG: hypothetical protein RXO36_05730 [Candidatus Nanopusillus acidilobi]|jgi:hypothetical protein
MNQKKTLGKFLSNINIKGLIFELFLKNTRETKVPEYFKNKGGVNYDSL